MKLHNIKETVRHRWMGNYVLVAETGQIMPGSWGVVEEGHFISEDGKRAKLQMEDIEHIVIKQVVNEMAKRPRQPRGGHYVVHTHQDGTKRARRIATAGKGYAYVDTGRIDRDVIPFTELEYVGHGGKGHMWKEK